MANKNIEFLDFNEAVAAAKNEPGIEFVGLRYVSPFTRLDIYMIDVDPDEPDYVRVQYEGGDLFDISGEEDFYDVADTPDEARKLFYARMSELGDGKVYLMGMTSESVLQEVLPGLDKTSTYKNTADFIRAASTQFLSFWRQS